MARTRSLKPSFFANDLLAECEPMARLLFAGLWTIADRDGRLEFRPRRIKGALFPYDNCDIEQLVAQLAARGFVQVYRAGGVDVLLIPTFGEHQRCHPDERSENLPPPGESDENTVFPVENIMPGNPTGEPGNFPATCALYPSSFNPSTSYPLIALSSAAPRARSKPADPLRWSDSGWEGITDADHAEWLQAYPAADLPVELAKAHQWLKANPKKARKSNWRKWLTTTWLTRCQDRGGTHREAARPGAPPLVDAAKKRFFRSDSQRSMTDAEHETWRRDRRNGGLASSVASALKITDEVTT
jgi:hypothetical protein